MVKFRFIIVIVLSMLFLMSCFGLNPPDPEEMQGEITVLTGSFNEGRYTNTLLPYFNAKYPKIEVNILIADSFIDPSNTDETSEEIYQRIMAEERPDVLDLTGPTLLSYLVQERLLYDLEAFIRQDREISLDEIHPPVIELLRSYGGGKLYGLGSAFSTRVMIYNKSLFEENGVPLPEDGMTWEDALLLAERIPPQSRIGSRQYGLHLNNWSPEDLFYYFASEYGIDYLDEMSGDVNVNTDEWREVAALTEKVLKSEVVTKPLKNNFDVFNRGNIAMWIADSNYIYDFLQRELPFEWDIATMPAFPSNPMASGNFGVWDILGLNAETSNAELAWEFVKFANSEEYANAVARTYSLIGFPARKKSAVSQFDDINIEAVYQMSPINSSFNPSTEAGIAFQKLFFNEIAQQLLGEVMAGNITVDEALQRMEEEGQAAFNALKEGNE